VDLSQSSSQTISGGGSKGCLPQEIIGCGDSKGCLPQETSAAVAVRAVYHQRHQQQWQRQLRLFVERYISRQRKLPVERGGELS
jgi:hypothetical protein